MDVEIKGPKLDLLVLSDGLDKLAVKYPRAAELVKLRFFAGLTRQQAAEALGVCVATADDDWAFAKSWLRVELAGSASANRSGTPSSRVGPVKQSAPGSHRKRVELVFTGPPLLEGVCYGLHEHPDECDLSKNYQNLLEGLHNSRIHR